MLICSHVEQREGFGVKIKKEQTGDSLTTFNKPRFL